MMYTNAPMLKKDTPEERKRKQSVAQRERDIAKHIRIANATSGHERDVHLAKAKEIQENLNSFNSLWAGLKRTVTNQLTK